jgi:sulfate adenylyltransferase subunit 2
MNKKQSATKLSLDLLGLDVSRVWDTELAFAHLHAHGEADTKRTAERRLNALGLMPQELTPEALLDERDRPPNQLVLNWAIEQARKRRDRVLFVQLHPLPSGQPCLHANDARGARFWIPMLTLDEAAIQQALADLQRHIGKPVSHPRSSKAARARNRWQQLPGDRATCQATPSRQTRIQNNESA